MHRLITIGVSHYCEKARWALQRAGLPFREEAHAPLFHIAAVKRNGGASTVPVLKSPEGQTLADSTLILEHLDQALPEEQKLYPSEHASAVRALEDRFDEALGPAVRRLVYGHVLHDRAFVPTLSQGLGRSERVCFRLGAPLVRVAMKSSLKLTPAGVERSRLKIEEVWAEVEALLGDGRQALCGERFSAADLSFAALSAPLVAPPEYGAELPPLEELPVELQRLVAGYRARPAGEFVLRLYREERARRAAA